MKKLLYLLMILSLLITGCSKEEKKFPAEKSQEITTSEIKWLNNLEDALKIAQTESKTVLINFTGSDWCGWCIKLKDEVFKTPQFQNYAKNSLVLVELDFPRNIKQSQDTKNYNQNLLKKFGIKGFPSIILLDKNGQKISQTGYQAGGGDNYVKHIKQLINR